MIWQQVAVCWQERFSCWQIKRREDAETTPLPWYVTNDAPPLALKLPSCYYLSGMQNADLRRSSFSMFKTMRKQAEILPLNLLDAHKF